MSYLKFRKKNCLLNITGLKFQKLSSESLNPFHVIFISYYFIFFYFIFLLFIYIIFFFTKVEKTARHLHLHFDLRIHTSSSVLCIFPFPFQVLHFFIISLRVKRKELGGGKRKYIFSNIIPYEGGSLSSYNDNIAKRHEETSVAKKKVVLRRRPKFIFMISSRKAIFFV